MSSGHRHRHNLTQAELDDLLDEVLANPKIKARLAKPYSLLTGFDIALLGSSSIGGAHVYLDRHLPAARLPVGTRNLNVIPGLIRHERLEQALEDILGWPYAMLAHPVAQTWEDRLYKKQGFNPKDVEKAFKPYIKADEHERIERSPTDLDQRPLLSPPQDRKLIARTNATAQLEKYTHSSVNYTEPSPRSGQNCSDCRRFIESKYGGPLCVGVQSPISANGWCKRFARGRLGNDKV